MIILTLKTPIEALNIKEVFASWTLKVLLVLYENAASHIERQKRTFDGLFLTSAVIFSLIKLIGL